ncbi:MAG: hypothetical protein CUN55_19470, partial [Phototrophicales bacterium]
FYNPQCGQLSLPLRELIVRDASGAEVHLDASAPLIQTAYIRAVLHARELVSDEAQLIVDHYIEVNASGALDEFTDADRLSIRNSLQTDFDTINTYVAQALINAMANFPGEVEPYMFSALAEQGWGGAALFYNRIGK